MTSEAPERIWARYSKGALLGNAHIGLIVDSFPAAGLHKYIRADLHRQALEAARAEGYAQAVDEAAKVPRAMGGSRMKFCEDAIRALSPTPADPVAEVDSFTVLISDAVAEAERAMQKFPQPNYVISKVAEEAGEVVKAAIHCAEGREDVSEVRAEMKQLIAMLYRLWVEGDGVHGLRALAQKEGE